MKMDTDEWFTEKQKKFLKIWLGYVFRFSAVAFGIMAVVVISVCLLGSAGILIALVILFIGGISFALAMDKMGWL